MRNIISVLTVAAMASAMTACGHDTTQRAATGAIGGAIAAGPVGAAVAKADGEK